MPVTAKLSLKFYERLGEDIANELVEWFNAVDATYRSDLRELNELNFARFDAKLEQRLAAMDSVWDRRLAGLEAKWERRLTQLEAKWEQRFTQLESSWEHRLAQLDAKWEERHAGLRVEIAAAKAELVRWAFLFWAPTALAVIGLYFKG